KDESEERRHGGSSYDNETQSQNDLNYRPPISDPSSRCFRSDASGLGARLASALSISLWCRPSGLLRFTVAGLKACTTSVPIVRRVRLQADREVRLKPDTTYYTEVTLKGPPYILRSTQTLFTWV